MMPTNPVLVREEAVVTEISSENCDIQRVNVRGVHTGAIHKVIVYLALTGPVTPGDTIVINTTATQLSLGTGGVDFAICTAHADRRESLPGHVMKLRYTPQQMPVLACEAQESPHHEVMREAVTLDGTPVICLELHSQLAAVCHGAISRARRPIRVAFVMTDQASLPIAFSELVRTLRASQVLCGTVTCGQAFGGDLEAVSFFSGMLAAKTILHADIIIAGPGPGNVGTDTPFGFSAVDQGIVLNGAASLGGTPVMCVRAGSSDARSRHNGLSHHSLTVLARVVLAAVNIPVAANLDVSPLRAAIATTHLAHKIHSMDVNAEWQDYLSLYPFVKSMGRPPETEALLFQCALAVGAWCAQTID